MKKNLKSLLLINSNSIKIFLIMKFFMIISLVAAAQVYATSVYSQDVKLNIDIEAVNIFDLFKEIENISEFGFFFKSEEFDPDVTYTVKMKNASIKEILNEVLVNKDYSYRIVDEIIIVTKDSSLQSQFVYQTKTVTGKVTDQSGAPIPGVSVIEKNTNNGSITNTEGDYSIKLETENPALIYSFVGMVEKEIVVGERTVINVILEEELYDLDEVVVIGYGTVKKRDLTGSVYSLKAKEIEGVPSVNIVKGLQGRVPGLDVYSSSSSPGSTPTLRIRGNRSIIASNNPLWVIDGVPVYNIQDFNLGEIESIEVLKDASATAIYGARAANGVIIATTKRGTSGKTNVNLDSYYGFETASNLLPLMNGSQFAEYKRDAYRNSTPRLYDPDLPDFESDRKIFSDSYEWESIQRAWEGEEYNPSMIRSTDWTDLVLRNGYVTNHQFSVSSGSEKFRVYFGGNYYKNQGIQKDEDHSRWSMRLNMDYRVNKFIHIGASNSYNHSITNNGSGLYGTVVRFNPLTVPYDENGVRILEIGGTETSILYNPLFDIENILDESISDRFLGSYFLELNLMEGLIFKSNFGPDWRFRKNGNFTGSKTSENRSGENSASMSENRSFRYTWDNLLTYEGNFNDIQRLNLTFVQSFESDRSEYLNGAVKSLASERQLYYALGSAETISDLNSGLSEWTFHSYMGRLNYILKDKYLFTFTGRWDGSSRLAEVNKWDFFPSAAVAWRMSDEPFLRNNKNINELKLRIGYGVTGNTAISPYRTQGTISRREYGWESGQIPAFGFVPATIPSYNLGWEKTEQFNFGLDFGAINNRLSGAINLYYQNTSDLLMERKLPLVFGFDNFYQNVGKTRNRGIEVSISSLNIRNLNGFQWRTDFTFSRNREEIVQLFGNNEDIIGSGWFIGHPINSYYDYKIDGVWQNTPEDLEEINKFAENSQIFSPGDIRIQDTNGDNLITIDDKVILGSNVPKWLGSISSKLYYKGLEFSFLIYARQGQMIQSDLHSSSVTTFTGGYNALNIDYWSEENPTNEFFKPSINGQPQQFRSALDYRDGSFVRLQTVTLAYSLPHRIISEWNISKLRFYATAYNSLLFTDYGGMDPETATGVGNPPVKSFIFGVNLGL